MINLEVRIKQCELIQGIRIVQRAVPVNPVISILKGFLMTAEKNRVKLFACDVDFYIETQLTADVIKPGKVVISAKILSDIVNKITDEYIEIIVYDKQKVNIKCKNVDIKLPCYSADNFPKMPDIMENNVINLKEKDLSKMISHTSFAISEKDERYGTDCELIQIKGDNLIMVGTDTRRVAISRHLIENNSKIDTKSYVEGKFLIEIRKLLSSNSENYIKIASDEQCLLFKTTDTKFCTRIPNVKFINHELVFPKKFNTEIKTYRKELLNLLEIAAVFFEKGIPEAVLDIGKSSMTISAKSDLGEINEKIAIDLSGEEMKILFNITYLLQGLRVIDEDKIIFSFAKGENPCGVIRPYYDAKDEGEYEYLIIPLKLKG